LLILVRGDRIYSRYSRNDMQRVARHIITYQSLNGTIINFANCYDRRLWKLIGCQGWPI
jgi:hypothetical protein